MSKANMQKAVSFFRDSIQGIRSGGVSLGLVDSVKVEYYGQPTLVKHLANTGKLGQNIFVDPHDLSITSSLAAKLKSAGFDAYQFSKARIIVNVPPLSGDEKQRVIKQLHKLAEEARISIRNVRKNWRQSLAAMSYSKERIKEMEKEIQEDTDVAIGEIDDLLDSKINNL